MWVRARFIFLELYISNILLEEIPKISLCMNCEAYGYNPFNKNVCTYVFIIA